MELFLAMFLVWIITGGDTGSNWEGQAVALEPADPVTEAPKAEVAPAAPAFQAEPQTPSGKFTTATEVRPILSATKGNWVGVRDFGGQDLVYVTHLWAWRCGLHEMRVGLNGAEPKVWPMPACHLDQPAPGAVLPGDGDPYRAFPAGSVQSLRVEILYDDLGTDAIEVQRSEVQIP